jgi:hypothetical protein
MVVTVEMKNDRDGRFFNFLRSHAVELITTKYFAFFFYSLLLQARTIVDQKCQFICILPVLRLLH